MKTARPIPALSLVCVAGLLAGPSQPAAAQQRDQLIRDGLSASADFRPQEAMALLRRGLDPARGARAALWQRGVQEFVRLHLDILADSARAGTWARWAFRLQPAMVIDTTGSAESFLRGARDSVTRSGDGTSRVTTTWEWAGHPDSAAGRVRVGSATPASDFRVLRVGAGLIDQGEALPPGSYAFEASAPGFARSRVTREILPSVVTDLRFTLTREQIAQAPTTRPALRPPAPAPTRRATSGGGMSRRLLVVGVLGVAGAAWYLTSGHGGEPTGPGSILVSLPKR